MASAARKSFDKNAEDIERLLKFHNQIGGTAKGRRYGLEVLNKSAIVLIVAFWEAYCEDVAAEGLAHVVKHARRSTALPENLRKLIAKELKADQHELAIWKIAGPDWRNYLKSRLSHLQTERNRRLNTPKTQSIDELFRTTLGLNQVSASWRWPKKMSSKRAADKLDRLVTLRGAIAHRGQHSASVKKSQVVDYFHFIKRLAARTGGSVNTHVKTITGKPLWD